MSAEANQSSEEQVTKDDAAESLQVSAGDQYLTFILNNETYGISILKVQSVQGWERVTQLPNSPDYVLGVINMRGDVVPIIDLRLRFAMGSGEFTERTVVIIVKVECRDHPRTVGLVVDAVSEVQNVRADEFREAPDLGNNISSEYIKGLGLADKGMVILLDIDRLISGGVMDVLMGVDAKEANSKEI